MANTVFAGTGKFFFQFGLLSFMVSIIYISLLSAYGLPIPSIMGAMSAVLPTIGLFSLIMGVFGMVTNFVRVIVPQLAQVASATVYLSLFLPASAGVVTLLSSIVAALPLPPPLIIALMSVITAVVPATIAYYLAVKMGYLPPE